MEQHVKILGYPPHRFRLPGNHACLGLVSALRRHCRPDRRFRLFAASAHVSIPILGGIAAFIFFFLLAISLPGVIAGIGLLQFRSWARILTIVLSVLDLIHVPFGTALGVYGLWVLLSQGSERLFRTA